MSSHPCPRVSWLWKNWVLTLLALTLHGGISTGSQAECPYSGSQGPIIAGFSLSSWDEYWNLLQARNMGMIVFETVTDDLLPTILDLADATGEIKNLPRILHEFVASLDNSLLRKASIQGTLQRSDSAFPGFSVTLRLTPPDTTVEKLYQDISGFMNTVATHSQEALAWFPGPEKSHLGLAVLESATSPAPVDGRGLLFLHRADPSVILTTDHLFVPGESVKGSSSKIGELWSRLPEPVVSSVVVDLTELAALLNGCVKPLIDLMASATSEAASSLVLDETEVALFDKDPETLEKLRKVEQDFNQLMPSFNPESISKPIESILDFLGDQGVLLSGLGPTPGGVIGTTLWSVDSTTPNGGLFNVDPLSPAMLSLLRPGIVEVSIQGLPDYQRIYSYFIELLKQFPWGPDLIGEWEKLQQTFGYSIEKDLLPAIGKETGWITRDTGKAGIPGLQVMSNDLFFVLGLKDSETMERSLNKIEETLTHYGFPVSATRVNDVTFSVLNGGLLGKAMWAELKQPPVFVLTTSTSPKEITGFLQMLSSPLPHGLTQHPRWDQFQRIWTDQPTAVTLSDLTTTGKQTLDLLKSSPMMVALMGSSGSGSLPFIRMGNRILQNLTPPEWQFTVNSVEPGLRLSRSLILYPPAEKDPEQR